MGSNTCNCVDYGGGRTLNGRPRLRIAVWLQVKVRGHRLCLHPIGYSPALSVTYSAAAAAVAACGAI